MEFSFAATAGRTTKAFPMIPAEIRATGFSSPAAIL
jgi:hypothetical protein